VLVVASTALALLLAEVSVRALAPQTLWFPLFDDLDGLRVLRPSVAGRHRAPGAYDVIEAIGPQRFRGAWSYTETPPRGKTRLAVLGDSFTYSVGVAEGETYPERVGQLLSQCGLNVEVMNAGIPGSGTGEQVLYFERWVRRFRPSVVVLTLTANDPFDDAERGRSAWTEIETWSGGVRPEPREGSPSSADWRESSPATPS
jgi:hypothetical protein